MATNTNEAVRDALRARLKTKPLMLVSTMPRAGYRVEGMNVERRIHVDQSRKLVNMAPIMCRNCAHMKHEEQDQTNQGSDVKIVNGLVCGKATTFTCPDGLRTEVGKWAINPIRVEFVGDEEPMMFYDKETTFETEWPPTDIARSAGFMDYISPDELRAINDKDAAYKMRRKTESSTPKTVDGDVW